MELDTRVESERDVRRASEWDFDPTKTTWPSVSFFPGLSESFFPFVTWLSYEGLLDFLVEMDVPTLSAHTQLNQAYLENASGYG